MTSRISIGRRRAASGVLVAIALSIAACAGGNTPVQPSFRHAPHYASGSPALGLPDSSPCLTSVCIYVSNSGGPGSVTAYAHAANGDVAPLLTISGSNTGLNDPQGIAVSGSHKMYVPNHLVDSLTVFAKGAHGNVAPVKTISGSNTGLDRPNGVALDPSLNIYIANNSATQGPGSVTVYAAGVNGNVAPIRTLSGSNTGLNIPSVVALDRNGKIYVANSGSPSSVTVYAAGANGNVAPIKTISGSNTGLSTPFGIAFDAGLNIYVTNAGNFSVTVYANGAHGNVAPIRTISGSNTGINLPEEIALDASGKIYVANCGCGSTSAPSSVTVYAAGANGNVAPIRTISGIATGLDQPVGITVH
jgi:hypothetical protein